MFVLVLVVFVVVFFGWILKPRLDRALHFRTDGAVMAMIIEGLTSIVRLPLIVVVVIVGLPQSELFWVSCCLLVDVVFVAMMLSLLVVFHPIVVFALVLPSTSLPHMSMANVTTKTVSRRILRPQPQDAAFVIVFPPLFKDLPQRCATDEGTTHLHQG